MTPAGRSALDRALATTYKKLLDRAPHARLVVAGYPRVLPRDFSRGVSLARLSAAQRAAAGIPPQAQRLCRTNGLNAGFWIGVTDAQATALSDFTQQLNATILRQVNALERGGYAGRISYANTWDSSVPHNCSGHTDQVSVNGIRFAAGSGSGPLDLVSDATFHPTTLGQNA